MPHSAVHAPSTRAPHSPAKGSSLAGRAYWAMVRRVILTAAAIDASYIPLFLWLGSTPLALVNLLSLGLYAVAYLLVQRRMNAMALVLIWAEVMLHAGLGSLLLGWDSGFHYYLLLFIPAIVIANSGRYAWPVVGALLLYYLGLRWVCDRLGPLEPLQTHGVQIINAIHVVTVFAMSAALARFYRRTILIAERKLVQQAALDALTGLNNRRHFHTLAQPALEQCQRRNESVSLILCDVDHFKQVNDQHGHACGDDVLVRVAQTLQSQVREADIVARWGGEEFLVLLPHSTVQDAVQIAERIRAAVAQAQTPATVPVTMSFGVTAVHHSQDLQAATARADRALYQSKHAGRNRVTVIE